MASRPGTCSFVLPLKGDLSASSKETEAFKAAEQEKASKPNGYLFDPDEDSDEEEKNSSDESSKYVSLWALAYAATDMRAGARHNYLVCKLPCAHARQQFF